VEKDLMTDGPSIGRLAGQIEYLFEDRPELRAASVDELVERLNHDDRHARAREAYQAESDDYVRAHVDEFPARITPAMVEEALKGLRGSDG
jgi:hypothetical protein